MEIEHDVARERFRSRILRLALVSIVFDLVVAALAFQFEQGARTSSGRTGRRCSGRPPSSSRSPRSSRTRSTPATKVLDVVLEAYAIVVVTSLAATFTDLLHHRTRRRMRQRFKAEAEMDGR